jgi:hypothetical protein
MPVKHGKGRYVKGEAIMVTMHIEKPISEIAAVLENLLDI